LTDIIRYYNISEAFGGNYNDDKCIIAVKKIENESYNTAESQYDYNLVNSGIITDSKWYIPSIKELELLFKEYNATNSRIKGAFDADGLNGVYWSCTEGDNCGHDTHTITTTTTSGDTKEPPVTYSSKVYVYDNQTNGAGKTTANKYDTHTVIQVCAF
jgi:hypothetical protein